MRDDVPTVVQLNGVARMTGGIYFSYQAATRREFAQLVRKKYDPKAKIVYQPLPQDDPKQRRPDISLARKELGWETQVALEEGISRTMEWFAKNYFQKQ